MSTFGEHLEPRQMKLTEGRLIYSATLERKMPEAVDAEQREDFAFYRHVLHRKRVDKDKVHSLHEPQVNCLSKGRERKEHQLGSKSSMVMAKNARRDYWGGQP